jgi:carbonic anhydrase
MKLFLLFLFVTIAVMGLGFAQESATPVPQPRTVAEPRSSAQIIWADLMEGNQRFISGKTKSVDVVPLRQSLASKQEPKVVVLACSDSRVSPEILFDKSLGDLFVVRSAGNVADAIGVGSIEYAVEHLGSSVLVVLGHTGCGAVHTACSGEKMPTPNLQAVIDKIVPAVARAKRYSATEGVEKAAVRENVHQSANDVIASSEVLQHFVHDDKLTVFEAVYDISSGRVVQLETTPSPNQQSTEGNSAVGSLSGFTWKH